MCGPKKSAWKWSLSKRYPEVWGAVHSHDCIEGIVPRHAWGVGRGGRLSPSEIDYRQLDMHSMCSLTGGSTVVSYTKYVKKA